MLKGIPQQVGAYMGQRNLVNVFAGHNSGNSVASDFKHSFSIIMQYLNNAQQQIKQNLWKSFSELLVGCHCCCSLGGIVGQSVSDLSRSNAKRHTQHMEDMLMSKLLFFPFLSGLQVPPLVFSL